MKDLQTLPGASQFTGCKNLRYIEAKDKVVKSETKLGFGDAVC
jgi:hypothetical protein